MKCDEAHRYKMSNATISLSAKHDTLILYVSSGQKDLFARYQKIVVYCSKMPIPGEVSAEFTSDVLSTKSGPLH